MMTWNPNAPLAMPLMMVILPTSRRPLARFLLRSRKLPRGVPANMGTTRMLASRDQVADQSSEITSTPVCPRISGPSSSPRNPPMTEAGTRNLRNRGTLARRNMPASSRALRPAVLFSRDCSNALVTELYLHLFVHLERPAQCVRSGRAHPAGTLCILSKIILTSKLAIV